MRIVTSTKLNIDTIVSISAYRYLKDVASCGYIFSPMISSKNDEDVIIFSNRKETGFCFDKIKEKFDEDKWNLEVDFLRKFIDKDNPNFNDYLYNIYSDMRRSNTKRKKILDTFHIIIHGMILQNVDDLILPSSMDKVETIFDGKVAINLQPDIRNLNKELFESGCLLVVYKDGYNLGVIRSYNNRSVDLSLLEGLIPPKYQNGWFFSESCCSYGTRKTKKKTPSFVDENKLIEYIGEILNMEPENVQ